MANLISKLLFERTEEEIEKYPEFKMNTSQILEMCKLNAEKNPPISTQAEINTAELESRKQFKKRKKLVITILSVLFAINFMLYILFENLLFLAFLIILVVLITSFALVFPDKKKNKTNKSGAVNIYFNDSDFYGSNFIIEFPYSKEIHILKTASICPATYNEAENTLLITGDCFVCSENETKFCRREYKFKGLSKNLTTKRLKSLLSEKTNRIFCMDYKKEDGLLVFTHPQTGFKVVSNPETLDQENFLNFVDECPVLTKIQHGKTEYFYNGKKEKKPYFVVCLSEEDLKRLVKDLEPYRNM